MKTLKSILYTIILVSISSNAQITKGNWMVGGSGSFYQTQLKSENTSTSNIGIELRPNIGYFFTDKFAAGVSPLFAYSKPEGGSSVTSYGVGPYIRYYLLNTEKTVNVLTHIGYSYLANSNTNNKSTALDFRAGPVIFFNSSVALEMTINYNINNLDSTTTYNILSLGLGFQIHLEKK